MDSRRRFLPRPPTVELTRDRGTKGRRLCGWPSNGVGVATLRDRMARETLRGDPSALESTRKKSFARKGAGRPYRKPTQVGKASSLR